jgi:hypothetical protein
MGRLAAEVDLMSPPRWTVRAVEVAATRGDPTRVSD